MFQSYLEEQMGRCQKKQAKFCDVSQELGKVGETCEAYNLGERRSWAILGLQQL